MVSTVHPYPVQPAPLPAAAIRWLPVWRRNLRVWGKLAGPAILGNFGEPLLYLLALGYGLGAFVGEVNEMPYVVFLASGIVCSSAMFTATFEGMYSAYTRMAVQRTWESMLAAPLDIRDVVLGEIVWGGTKSLFSGTAILVVATLLGAVQSWQAILAIPAVFLTGLCFSSLALMVTSVARSYDFFLYYNTLFITPMLLVAGVFFPIDRMPAAIQVMADFLPLTHSVALIRPLMTGIPLQAPLLHLLVLALYAGLGTLAAVTLIRRRLTA